MSLYTILPKTELKGHSLYWIDQRVFMKRSQIFGKTLYYEGDISYFESVNRETISNAIGRLKQLGCIKLHKGVEPPPESVYETSPHSTNANTTWIAVAKDWIPAERLPDSNLRENVNERNNRKEWEGSATTFAIDPVRVSRPKNLRNNINYYQNETDDIEKITDLSKKSPTAEIKSDAQEDDKAYIYWNELRPKGRLVGYLYLMIQWEFCEQIGRFRREGKNRRDTSTVANRVLRLAQFASEPSLDGKKKQKQALKVVETKAKL
ncbi:hypothetical protein HDV02_000449 [Globomyces sp. JEL0801]|nr:hypothetical protein HDV02_000449 [Globomyces sp. JEL0801]